MKNSGASARGSRGLRLVLRDFQILEALHTARYLTTPQIEKLFWRASQGGAWGCTKACQQRLKRLYEHGLVRRIEQPVKRGESSLPYVYALARKGAALLVSELGVEPAEVDWRPRSHEAHFPFLEHLLTTTDFRISLTQGCDQTGVLLQEWVDEKEMKRDQSVSQVTLVGPQGGTSQAAVVPDGYFMLCRGGKCGIFFLEVDLKTVTVAPSIWERRGWMRKIRAYEAYFKTEAYRTQYAGRLARVLTVTSSPVRMENLKQATETVFAQLVQAGESTALQANFWFTVFSPQMDPGELLTAPIWAVAGSDTPQVLLE